MNDEVFDLLFRGARTYNSWQDKDVTQEQLREIYNLIKWGPTSANCSPMRTVFVTTEDARQRLKPHLNGGNVEKTMSAPVTAIFAHDLAFYEHMPRLFPHTDAKSWFAGKPDYIQETAFRNATLQAAYFMLGVRAMGLDCGPMSGFDPAGVKDEFFKEDAVEVNLLCNIGYGDQDGLHPRGPRFDFDEVCTIL